ncbi:MAG: cell division protein FtsL [bacterium]|nr:MAG: cell division protein FtsL [bacterium]
MARKTYRTRSFIRSFNQVQQQLDRPTNGLIALLLIVVIAMTMMGLVWQKVKVTQLVQEIEQLEKQLTYYKEMNEKLQGKVLHLSNEDRIVNIARTKLNMTYPPYEMVSLPGRGERSGE